ncbi:MAG TPA: CPBP family intramembrane glutamic endopeptidase [Terracidiphilus sp.]|jgi:hypothetical protein
MSSLPDPINDNAEHETARAEWNSGLEPEPVAQIAAHVEPFVEAAEPATELLEERELDNVAPTGHALPPTGTPLFAHYEYIPPVPQQRIPNLLHVLLFVVLLIGGFLCSSVLFLSAIHHHVFGVSTADQAKDNIDYTLGTETAIYLITLGGCMIVFPLVWRKGFFKGLQWRAATAFRLRWRLVGAAVVCFIFAMINELLIPGPVDTPIDRVFRLPGAAWLLFAFGVTLAPLFEEIAYRGFLLPALCTAYDAIRERITGTIPPANDDNDHPRWSFPAMTVASIIASIPFALMHGEQTSYSLGPFLLLVCVSLVLCGVRLATRSLAASVIVHSCYNLILFSLMLAVTGGFRHLDKM